MDMNYDSYFERMGILADFLQINSFFMNISQISNDEIMKSLQHQDLILDKQDLVLDEQTNIYLKKIIKQNEEILELLKNILKEKNNE